MGGADTARLRVMAEERDESDPLAAYALAGAADEIDELRRRLGGGCEQKNGGYHTVVSEGRYKFCAECGESLTGVRYNHAPKGEA